jgi:aminoglycoside 3-N-acetyltransferase
MSVKRLYDRLVLISPYMEVLLRHLYWRNVGLFSSFNYNKPKQSVEIKKTEFSDFNKVLDWLQKKGIKQGSLLIVHSGYGELECTGLSPEQVIDRLLELLGPTGTLAMPVIRRYKEIEKAKKEGAGWQCVKGKYNVKKTMVTSGMLPYTLMQRDDAVISHHPFNPLCAVGPLAEEMMMHNLDGIAPSPHGPNSCWKFCYDHGAKVCAIGTDIEHHNTILHITEEAFGDWYWPDDIWYDQMRFDIIDENKDCKEYVVSNRKEEWGKLHLAEINLCRMEKKSGILCSDKVDGISVGFVDPQKMVEKLRTMNKKGYPYYLLPWQRANQIV